MQKLTELLSSLAGGALDSRLVTIDGPQGLSYARERALRVARGFAERFAAGDGKRSVLLASAPGRAELGGNHTDHQRGRVLCASIGLDALACAGANGLGLIRLYSEGYGELCVDTAALSAPVDAERGHTAALVRGVAAGIAARGFRVSGFDAYVASDVLSGSGLSSSAAFEVLLGCVMNALFCGGAIPPLELAAIGQAAENVYFGKPCGLLDQTACSLGGVSAIDFADPGHPQVEPIACDFERSGHSLCIVDTGSCHDDLTAEYAAIPDECRAVAAHFGADALRGVDPAAFSAEIPALRRSLGDRAVLRAMHFFAENERVSRQAAALRAGDFAAFLALVNESGRSSAELLENLWAGDAREQPIPLALALARDALGGAGACRVHGGGFAGTIAAFVPHGLLGSFTARLEAVFGPGSCHVLRVRPEGGAIIDF